MIKESKYILRRILVGVGIVLVLSFIRGYKVKALSWSDSDMKEVVSFKIKPNEADNIIYYNSSNDRYYMKYFYEPNNYSYYINNASSLPYFICHQDIGYDGSNWASINGNSSNYYVSCRFTDKKLSYIWYGDFNGSSNDRYFISNEAFNFGSFTVNDYNYSCVPMSGTKTVMNHTINGVVYRFASFDFNYRRNSLFVSNYDMTNYKDNSLYFEKNNNFDYFLPSSASKIISFNPVKLNSENGVIITYLFSPKFSNFNTNNFVYQYKFGNGTTWLSLTENEQVFRVNNNGTIYVRVKDKNTNEVVDSQTFTITDIGTFATQQDYNITFSGEYRTENYLNNNISSKTQSIIKEYQIYVDYTPKSSILKYQYQYVNNGDSLDSNNWSNVSSLDNGSFTYVASQNGTLYARILDSSDNVLFTNTFTVDSIGSLAIDSNKNGVNNFFTKISSKINYGGPVSSLFVIPVNTLNSLYSSMSNSSSCSPILLGSLLGTNMQFGCYDFKSIVGNEVYNIIDIIFAFVLTIGVFKFILKLYNNFISMKEV